ncbi:hypothetical protein [Reyranella soli]|nr:hypothetical protein [Reyranella soli]
MTKRPTVVLPDYPPILLAPIDLNNSKAITQCLDALAIHYHLNPPFGGFFTPTFNHPYAQQKVSKEEMHDRWIRLAFCLMQDFVPALRKRRKGGRPKMPPTRVDYPHAHAARLVQIVLALRRMLAAKGMPSTNIAAFKQLAWLLKKDAAPEWRYGNLKKASAFAQAWKSIPKSVKDRPDSYLPPSPKRPPVIRRFKADGPEVGINLPSRPNDKSPDLIRKYDDFLAPGFLTPLQGDQDHPLWLYLPSIPTELAK